MTITVQRTISMGHRLPSYLGICSSPHGHNVRIEVEIETQGAFIDFKAVDGDLRLVTDPMDHAMVLWQDDILLPVLKTLSFRTYVLEDEPTTEAIAWELHRAMTSRGWDVIRTTVFETDKYSATVRKSKSNVAIVGGVS